MMYFYRNVTLKNNAGHDKYLNNTIMIYELHDSNDILFNNNRRTV